MRNIAILDHFKVRHGRHRILVSEADLDAELLELAVLQLMVVEHGFERQSDLYVSAHAHKLGVWEPAEV